MAERSELDGEVDRLSLAVASADPQVRARRLNDLGAALRRRYAETDDVADLHAVVDALTEAAALEPAFAVGLSVALSDRYERLGDDTDLTAAVAAAERAIGVGDDEQARLRGCATLGVNLSDRYDRTGDIADLQQAIDLLTEAVGGVEESSTEGLRWSDNLVMLLLDRFERLGDGGDLDRAVLTAEGTVSRAVQKDDRSPELPGFLINLGNAYRLRFEAGLAAANPEEGVSVGDLLLAVEAYRRSADRLPRTSVYRAKALTNLGSTLIDRAAFLPGLADDLGEAVTVLGEAVELTAPGSPDRSGRSNNLAAALSARYDRDHDPADLERGVATYREAVTAGLENNLELASVAATNWGAWAGRRESWAEAVEAYDGALVAFDRLRRAQLLDDYRRAWLRAGEGVAAEAAYARTALGQGRSAVEALERGRALLLADALRREDSALLALRDDAPQLAERYVRAARALRALELGG
jgi:tetratricopeptide (TPR) repeat protein